MTPDGLQMEPREVQLTLPPETAYLRIARLAVIAIAEDVGLGHDDIDDLRIALDELVMLLLESGPSDRPIELSIRREVAGLSVEGWRTADERMLRLTRRAERILGAAVDSFDVATDRGRHWFKIEKRAGSSR